MTTEVSYLRESEDQTFIHDQFWYCTQQGELVLHLRAPEKRVSLGTNVPGFDLIISYLEKAFVLNGAPDSTKKAPFNITSPSDLHVHLLHSSLDAPSLFVTFTMYI